MNRNIIANNPQLIVLAALLVIIAIALVSQAMGSGIAAGFNYDDLYRPLVDFVSSLK